MRFDVGCGSGPAVGVGLVTMLPSPLDYSDYRQFLKNLYQTRKATLAAYSYRQFSQDLGFQFSNYIHLVIQKKRNLSEESIRKIKLALPWSAHEKKYFHEMVLLNQCEDPKKKQELALKIQKTLEKNRTLIGQDQYAYFSHWYLPVIREIISLKRFVTHLSWIAKTLRIQIGEDKIAQALKVLERLKMIVSVPGGWKQSREHLSTEPEVASEMILGYHRQMIELSRLAIDFPASVRDFSAMTMSLSEEQWTWVKKRVVEFRDELQQELQASSANASPSLVAQINLQLFRLTHD